jgi:adenylate kinase family enzyme
MGTSGSGKTTVARRVAAATGATHLELDAVFWDSGWRRRDLREAREMVATFLTDHPDAWVADGNWQSALEGRMDPGTPGGADVIVWLDLPRHLVMRRVIWRTLRRGILREELWNGNRERLGSLWRWDPESNIIRWSWTSHARNREEMHARISRGEPIVRLTSPAQIEAWIGSLSAGGRTVEG